MIADFQDLRHYQKEKGVSLFSRAPVSKMRSSRWKLIKEKSKLELSREREQLIGGIACFQKCSIIGHFQEEARQPN